MYIIAIAWLYVIALLSFVTESVSAFIFGGLAPVMLCLWLAATSARRKKTCRQDTESNGMPADNDSAESAGDQ